MLKLTDGQGRRTEGEIRAEARARYGVELVAGVERVLESSRAVCNRDWVASFTDARMAWYVHLDGEGELQWLSARVPDPVEAEHVCFVLGIGFGNGSPLPQPTGQFDLYLNEEPLLSLCVTKEDRRWRGEGATLFYKVKRLEVAAPGQSLCLDAHIEREGMASFGIGLLRVPREAVVRGEPARFRVVPRCGQPSQRWFKLDSDQFARLIFKADLEEGLQRLRDTGSAPTLGEYRIYFGDIHTHSGEDVGGSGRTCGLGTIAENYTYARDVAGLDIYSLSDHDWQIADSADWRYRLEQCDRYQEEGRFVTLPSFEWTSLKYGHRNVYYREPSAQAQYFDASRVPNAIEPDCDSPSDLWRRLRESGVPAITAAHHSSTGFFPVDWSYWDPEFDRLVEVYSTWGNSEHRGAPHSGWASDREDGCGALDALLRGYRLGLIASSDGHDGHPGNAQWSDRQPHLHHYLGSGLVAVLADELTREAVFGALHARRCYATTGTRLLLDFSVNGRPMGSTVPLARGTGREVFIRAVGTTQLRLVEVVRNGLEVCAHRTRGRVCELSVQDDEEVEGPTFYYVRVTQADGEMAWSSPVWLERE